MPGKKDFIEEWYIDDKRVDVSTIKDPGFLEFKQKMVEMFQDKFYLDENGFIREFGTEFYKGPSSPHPNGTPTKTK